MPRTLESLRAVDVRKIDLEDARRHFGLSVEEQFSSRRALVSGLSATKAEMVSLFKNSETIEVWRGMDCNRDWAERVEQGDDLGDSWAWRREGALKGSSLDQAGASGLLIKGVVDESDVDWALTIAVGTFHEAEFEIVIADPSAVTLTTIIEWPSEDVIRDFAHEFDGPAL